MVTPKNDDEVRPTLRVDPARVPIEDDTTPRYDRFKYVQKLEDRS